MRGRKSSLTIVLTAEDRAEIERWQRATTCHAGLARRGRALAAAVREIADLYTRPLRDDEAVLCVDEKTSLQPRPRKSPTLAAQPKRPVRVEHEYGRCGALNLFAAFDTRTGKVYGMTAERKRQAEFIAFLEQLDHQIPATVKTVHVVL